jgi:ParB-like chromosome segregation protein Spo0J
VNPRIEEIPLTEFDLSLSGMRIMNPARILQVEKSMRLHGQLHPVVARVCAEGYQMIDGFKRYHVAEDLMMEILQCFVLEIELSQASVPFMTGVIIISQLLQPARTFMCSFTERYNY